MQPIRTAITHKGQAYYDEEIFAINNPKPIAASLAAHFRGVKLKPVKVLTGYQKVNLNWR